MKFFSEKEKISKNGEVIDECNGRVVESIEELVSCDSNKDKLVVNAPPINPNKVLTRRVSFADLPVTSPRRSNFRKNSTPIATIKESPPSRPSSAGPLKSTPEPPPSPPSDLNDECWVAHEKLRKQGISISMDTLKR